MSEKKAFQSLPEGQNVEASRAGATIYRILKMKYPEKNDTDLDMILNSLCAALLFHINENVKKDNQRVMLQIIYKILSDNI